MDFLKSAVASAIAKGPPFPYTFADRVPLDHSIWNLHNGTSRADSTRCSIFSFDITTSSRSLLPLARNALRKFKTLRHPGVVKVLDTVETDTYIYIATERIEPLAWKTKRKAISEASLKWGLHSVAKTLAFINSEASSVHGNVRLDSVFTSESGEWKLAGLEILSSMKEDDAIIYTYGSSVPDANRYAPPEVAKGGWDVLKSAPIHAVDSFQFAALAYEAFNASYGGPDQLVQPKLIPRDMQASYKRLINSSPKVRLSIAHFLEQGRRPGGYFDSPLVHLSEGVDSLGLKSEAERDEFLSELDTIAESDDLPEEFFKIKILPELLKSAEFGGGGPKVMSLIMRIGKKLSEDEYTAQITPVIVRLFSSPDRALRVCLLDNLPLMIDMLAQKTVTDKLFPQIVTGFSDLAPIVREQTVKSVLTIMPKLSDRVINGELLRHLAKTANDDQPGIRTNTTICLGKIAKSLGANTRSKVLIAAFTRSLRDPFVHGRAAACMALAATVDLYGEEDCAARLLPALCPLLTDKEKPVREQANKALDLYLARVRKFAISLPDSVLPSPSDAQAQGRNATAPAEGSSWTGWAISSFTNKLGAASGNMSVPAPVSAGATSSQPSRTGTPTLAPGASSANLVRPPPSSTASAPLVPLSAGPGGISGSGSRSVSPGVTAEDFAGDWGDDTNTNNGWAMDDGGDNEEFDAWGDEDSKVASRPKVEVSKYDDQGEPDFEGWLSAQAAKKKGPAKKVLPKGIARSKTESAGAAGASKKTGAVKLSSAAPPKKVAEETLEDDWGDAWD